MTWAVASRAWLGRRQGKRNARRTGIEAIWNGVKHICIHVRVDGPVSRWIVRSGDEHRVSLGDAPLLRVDLENRIMLV